MPTTSPPVCAECKTAAPKRARSSFALICPDCKAESSELDAYTTPPLCHVDKAPATHFAPVKRRFLCAGCAPRVGLNDSHKI